MDIFRFHLANVFNVLMTFQSFDLHLLRPETEAETSMRLSRECLKMYTEEDINQRIIPFKKQQLRELQTEMDSLQVTVVRLFYFLFSPA